MLFLRYTKKVFWRKGFMAKKDLNIELNCSFCQKNQEEVKKLVAGPSVYICDSCIKLCERIIQEEQQKQKSDFLVDLPTPHGIKEFLDKYIIAQDDAKKILAVAVYNHYKRINASFNNPDIMIQKSNILLIGPSGSGKTLLAQSLAKLLKVPFCIFDATTLTQAGYVGEDAESILQSLLSAADNDVEKAAKGIVYIDEIDKIAKKGQGHQGLRDVSGEGVQQSLLKIIEGSVVAVSPRGNKKFNQSEVVHMDTKDILFICGGAFDGLDKILAHKKGKSLGFMNNIVEINTNKNLETKDLVSYGFIPEFIGRLPITALLNEIKEEELISILSKPKNALIKQYQKLFALDGIELNFTQDALVQIAKKALMKKTGARGLRSILEDTLLEIMYKLPTMTDVQTCTITKDVIDNNQLPLLSFKKQQKLA